jgi:phosphinothricin acetyltransferase
VIRDARDDAAAIAAIYNHYVEHTVITFEELPVDAADMAARITEVQARWPWLVWEAGSHVQGFAYASTWKTRSAYRHTVETTVYLAPAAVGRGIGSALYAALIARLQPPDVHCLVACIALPNEASEALHRKHGFAHAGVMREVGRKFGKWVDVVHWTRCMA